MKRPYKQGLRCVGCGKEIPPGERRMVASVGARGGVKVIGEMHTECFSRALPSLGDPLVLLRRKAAVAEATA